LDGEVSTFEWSKDHHRIKIRTEGKFKLTDDWTGIASLARDARMRFEEEDGRIDRRLDVEPGSGGSPVYTWKIGGEKRAFDAEGRKWLQGMLLQFVRATGYEAERRVAWILQRQGPNGVLAEISQIPSDYAKRIYFQQLFAHRGLGADVAGRALAQAGREIQSDYDLREALLAAAGATAMAYVEATRAIESDYDHRVALTGLLEKGRLDAASLAALLRSARQINSDYDLATLLTEVSKRNALADAGARGAYVEAAQEIHSDYDHRRALSAAVQRGDLPQDTLLAVLRSARSISSSYDRATLLIEIAGKYRLSGAAREGYLEAARTISSDDDRRRAERALQRGPEL
jgi:hypothetical protein